MTHSCIYEARVMHNRQQPAAHSFHYKVFMFYICLDELETLPKKFSLISRNSFNLFSFRDSEHVQWPADNPDTTRTIKQHLILFLNENGFTYTNEKIYLLTNLNVLGYNFNPVSFYFLVTDKGEPKCAVAEVSNTFREMKLYYLGMDTFLEGAFRLRVPKYFYVSPFIDLDASFDFVLQVPERKLNIRIDDYKNGERFFISTLTGERKEISNALLFWYSLRFPIIPLRIMWLIHFNAFRLWRKKVRFFRKQEHQHLQRGVLRKYPKQK